jgi:hypothetical protein
MRRLLWTLLLAVAAPAAHGDDKPQDSRKEEDEESGPVRLEVPAELRGKGYRLRYGGDVVELDAPAVSAPDGGDYNTFQLVDRDGRILDSDDGYLEDDAIAGMRPNHYRVGLHVGSSSSASSELEDLFLDGHLSETSLDFTWLPGAFGLSVSYAGLNALEEVDPSVTSSYSELQWRVGAVYELVPFRDAASHARSLHLDLTLAALHAQSSINIGDGAVDIRDESSGNGLYAGADLMFPIFDFWLNLRAYLSRSKLEFTKLGHKSEALRSGLLLGGFYAF